MRYVVAVYDADGQRGAISVHGTWETSDAANTFAMSVMATRPGTLADWYSVEGKTLKAVDEVNPN